MLAKDIMTREVITVRPDTSIEEAAKLMVDNKVSGLPVVDEEGKIVGIVTEKDLMVKASEFKIPFYITLFDSIIFLENPIKFNNHIRKYFASQVKEVMTARVVTVDEETPVPEVARIMQTEKVNRVPVTQNGVITGIITRNDILKSLVRKDG